MPVDTEDCADDPQNVACAYPHTPLQKYLITRFAETGGKAAAFLKKFHWTKAQQNEVSLMIAEEELSPSPAGGEEVCGAQRKRLEALAVVTAQAAARRRSVGGARHHGWYDEPT